MVPPCHSQKSLQRFQIVKYWIFLDGLSLLRIYLNTSSRHYVPEELEGSAEVTLAHVHGKFDLPELVEYCLDVLEVLSGIL